MVGGRGRKTVVRSSANVSAFSRSVFAQVLSGFRIGDMCCWGRFILRVDKHKRKHMHAKALSKEIGDSEIIITNVTNDNAMKSTTAHTA